jgi:hypothetical protein
MKLWSRRYNNKKSVGSLLWWNRFNTFKGGSEPWDRWRGSHLVGGLASSFGVMRRRFHGPRCLCPMCTYKCQEQRNYSVSNCTECFKNIFTNVTCVASVTKTFTIIDHSKYYKQGIIQGVSKRSLQMLLVLRVLRKRLHLLTSSSASLITVNTINKALYRVFQRDICKCYCMATITKTFTTPYIIFSITDHSKYYKQGIIQVVSKRYLQMLLYVDCYENVYTSLHHLQHHWSQ